MNNSTYVIGCAMGRNKENCHYNRCVTCDAAVYIKRNREDYNWQNDEPVEEKSSENIENSKKEEEKE